MTEQLEKMQHQYDALANQMSEATVHPEAMDQPPVYICTDGWCAASSSMKAHLRYALGLEL